MKMGVVPMLVNTVSDMDNPFNYNDGAASRDADPAGLWCIQRLLAAELDIG